VCRVRKCEDLMYCKWTGFKVSVYYFGKIFVAVAWQYSCILFIEFCNACLFLFTSNHSSARPYNEMKFVSLKKSGIWATVSSTSYKQFSGPVTCILENVLVAQLVKKFPPFYQRFITMLMKANNIVLSSSHSSSKCSVPFRFFLFG
jgi:hypothetical protein